MATSLFGLGTVATGTERLSRVFEELGLPRGDLTPDRLLPRCHALATMATLPPPDELAAPSAACIDYPEVPATARAAIESAGDLQLGISA